MMKRLALAAVLCAGLALPVVATDPNGLTRQYEYDAFGNRTKCTQDGGPCQATETIAATSNHSDIVSYDARGNVTAQSSHTYGYDELHMMTSDQYGSLTREFVYNANDQRIAVLTSATTGSWWRWTFRNPLTGNVLREFTSQGLSGTLSWKWEKDYLWRDHLLLATIQPNTTGTGTTTYHYHLDHLGTPRRITDDTDLIVGVHDYHAFGPETSSGPTEPSLSLMKYTGHERDVVDGQGEGLDYMLARYYSPAAGRFLSVDPGRAKPRDSQSWNRYSYTGNNPVDRVDPDGKDWYSVLFASRHKSSGVNGRIEHEAIVWIDPRGYGTTYEHGAYYAEYVGPYSGSFANTRKGGGLFPTRFRNLGPHFDPSKARATRDVGTDARYSVGTLQCTNYCGFLIGDNVYYSLGQIIGLERFRGLPPHPNLYDRETSDAYVPDVFVSGEMWPADIAAGVGGEFIEVTAPSTTHVSYPDAHLFARPIANDGGSVLYCYNGACF